MRRSILFLTFCLFLAVAAVAQEKKPLTLAELKKDLTIVSLRIENMELRYRNLKTFKERLEDRISKLESTARKAATPTTAKMLEKRTD